MRVESNREITTMNNQNQIIQDYLGSESVVENCQRIEINELVRIAMKSLKKRLVEAQIEALGVPVSLTTSKTRFYGARLWFLCPACNRRVGIIYRSQDNDLGCRECLRLIYKKQIEGDSGITLSK